MEDYQESDVEDNSVKTSIYSDEEQIWEEEEEEEEEKEEEDK